MNLRLLVASTLVRYQIKQFIFLAQRPSNIVENYIPSNIVENYIPSNIVENYILSIKFHLAILVTNK